MSLLNEVAEAAGGHGVKPIPTVVPTPTEYQAADEDGVRVLWVVFVIMTLASALFTFLSWNVPIQKRLYHVITTLITITAALSYFAMATGHAVSYNCQKVTDEHQNGMPDTHHEVCRQVYWARYVDWSITTPLLLLDLCLLAGIDGGHTLMAIAADLIMILTGLFAAYGSEQNIQKWGWYAISCIAYLFVIWHLVLHGSMNAKSKGERIKKLFASLAAFTLILWTIYPIVWGIADGSRKASVDVEIVGYAILDVLAKPVFGFWLLVAHRQIAESNVDIGGWWSNGLGAEGRIRLADDEGA